MTITSLDIAIVVWGLAGTMIVNRLLAMLAAGQCSRPAFVSVTMLFMLMPLIVMRLGFAEHSAFGVMAAVALIFWLAVLGARAAKYRGS